MFSNDQNQLFIYNEITRGEYVANKYQLNEVTFEFKEEYEVTLVYKLQSRDYDNAIFVRNDLFACWDYDDKTLTVHDLKSKTEKVINWNALRSNYHDLNKWSSARPGMCLAYFNYEQGCFHQFDKKVICF